MDITVTLTIPQLLALPGDAVFSLINHAKADRDFIQAAYAAESAGKARWVILNHLRGLLKTEH